ncbi:MAG: formyl-CoA transferase [Acidobacteria bacterium]|nr:MAG: formyl-CoA transferase [Acidobacteriota bacterium]PYR44558.1 MAG: formyl-CoA transferase [Acidobacteriota bacterium]
MAPLDGLRVIDLTRVVAGPFCTMMLGDMGAEVLKIEEPEHGDDSRGWAPFIAGTGSFYLALNRSKKSVALDLKAPEGAAALRRLIETADVLIESFRPGSLAELGFDYDAMSALNPRLIYCSISGYGQTGPAAELPGYDAVIQGEAGIMDMTGFPDGAPTRVGVAITDYLAGLYAIQGILLALTDRQKSGLGQRVDIALFEAMLSVMRLPLSVLLATGATPSRVGNDHLNIAPYEPLRAQDGLIIVAVANPGLWGRFCDAIERPALRDDPRFRTNTDRVVNRDALKHEIETVFRGLTVQELTRRFEAKNVPCGRVRSISEALEHPQVAAREVLMVQQHPQVGNVETLAPVIRLSRTPAEVRLPPPALGEHTAEVLAAVADRHR